MLKFKPENFHPTFVCRIPLLPVQIEQLSEETLQQAFQDIRIKEALYLASPLLYSELERYYNNLISEEKDKKRLILSFAKYYSRMQARCTPYGLFAGCSTGTFGERNELLLPENGGISRQTRPDMNFVCELAQQLTHGLLKDQLQYYPNNSIYRIGDQLRYVEYQYIQNKRRHQITSVQDSVYLQAVLEKAASGCKPGELADTITSEDIDKEAAVSFVHELINCQLLVSELEPNITGKLFTEQLIQKLTRINSTLNDPKVGDYIVQLTSLQQQLDACDKNGYNTPSVYRAIFEDLRTLNGKIDETQLFQADVYLSPRNATLNEKIKSNLLDAVNAMNKLTPGTENTNLKIFRENFLQQYEDAELPLLQVLDKETGIGYPSKDLSGHSNLIDDIFLPKADAGSTGNRVSKAQLLLLQKYMELYKQDASVITLTDEELRSLSEEEEPLFQPTISVGFKVLNRDGKLLIHTCGGTSATFVLGRFAHGSPEIHEVIKDITRFEKKLFPDKILAEIIHLPESRLGNVILRPVFSEYEIPYLSPSALPEENRIELQDLYVSVKGDRIILRSGKLDKEIIPRLGTAHNFSFDALPVYQFLGDMQSQFCNKKFLSFDWGVVTSLTRWLPRIEYRNCILAPARWILNKTELKTICDSGEEALQAFMKEKKIPSRVLISQSDNELLVDFENTLSRKVFLSFARKNDQLILLEFLFDEENALVGDTNGGRYTNECIATLFNTAHLRLPGPLNTTKNTQEVKRSFIPGSEWLYYKLYCGIKTADTLLTNIIGPLMLSLQQKGLIDQWFFIRYTDPEHHIRLRMHTGKPEVLTLIIREIRQALEFYEENGMVSKVQTDTYKRELERYGHQYITIAESIFHIDSETILEFLGSFEGAEGEKLKWQFASRSIENLMDDFRLSLAEKCELMETMKTNFTVEHGNTKELKIQLDNKYRQLKKDLESAMTFSEETEALQSLKLLLEKKSKQVRSAAQPLLAAYERGELPVKRNSLLASYIHMTLNRLFTARQRTHELVIYNLLYRHYKSRMAQDKAMSKQV